MRQRTPSDTLINIPRGRLRTVTTSHVTPAYLDWLNDPVVNQYLESRFSKQTMESLESFVRTTSADPSIVFLAIEVGEEWRHIGNIKLGPINKHHRTAEIGIMIGDRGSWGHGYAREAIHAMARYAFSGLGVAKITAGAYAANSASIRAFEYAGFRVEGRRESQVMCGEGRDDVILLGCAPDDLQT